MESQKEQTTAILVFARSAKEEQLQKKIRNGQELFDVLTQHTFSMVGKTGIPFYHFSENEQKGRCFGERFVHAIQSVFDKGYDRIITIGNDSPHLKSADLINALQLLDTEKLVLGPSADGGFYLLGLHKDYFDPFSFRELPWQTSRLATQLKAQFFSMGLHWKQLRWLYDIDSAKDLEGILRWAGSVGSRVLVSILNSALDPWSNFRSRTLPIWIFESQIPQNRGSPRLQVA